MTQQTSRKISFGAQENLALAKVIAQYLGLPWHNNRDPGDAVFINAAYAALESLERDGVSFADGESQEKP